MMVAFPFLGGRISEPKTLFSAACIAEGSNKLPVAAALSFRKSLRFAMGVI
jgi:hypothetical protein